MGRPVRVLGAGGHAKVLVSTLIAAGRDVIGVHDDRPDVADTAVLGCRVLGPIRGLQRGDFDALVGIGDNAARRRIASQLDLDWGILVHPQAIVHETAKLGPGTVVFAGAIIQPDAVLGAHCIVNTGATIDHDCELGSFVHIAPGVHLCGAVRIGEGALMGVGSSAIPGISIGRWSTVGGGACCVRDVPNESVAKGVPARSAPRPRTPR